MAWEEDSCICLNMQLIAILSRIGVIDELYPQAEAFIQAVEELINPKE